MGAALVVGLMGIVALLAFASASSSSKKPASQPVKTLPPFQPSSSNARRALDEDFVLGVIDRLDTAKDEELVRASDLSEEYGWVKSKEIIDAEIQHRDEIKKIVVNVVEEARSQADKDALAPYEDDDFDPSIPWIGNPLPVIEKIVGHEISNEDWQKWLLVVSPGKADTVTANYNLGVFLLSMRQLQEQGLVKDVKQGDYKGRKVWLGTWVKPFSLDWFLGNERAQYVVFARELQKQAKYIASNPDYQEAMKTGKMLEGTEGKGVTLSGLLTVARKAGLGGLASWFAKPEDRAAHKDTTDLFNQANGIF